MATTTPPAPPAVPPIALRHPPPRGPGRASPARARHESTVLGLLRGHGPLTRGELAGLSGLSRSTLSEVVGALVDARAVRVEVPETAGRGRGRPAERVSLDPAATDLLGVDFAPTAVRAAATATAHGALRTASVPHRPDLPWEARVALAGRLARSLTGGAPRAGTPPDAAAVGPGVRVALGVGAGTPAGPDEGPDDAVRALLRERFGARAHVESAARLAALAERTWGAAAGERDVLYLHLSHRVGGALVVGGEPHRGAHGGSGRFGHLSVDPYGPPCACGRSGCLETLASVDAVLAAHGSAADVPQLAAALAAGDPAARAALARAGRHAGRALADLCHAFGPDTVVVGGELAGLGPALTGPLRDELDANMPDRGARTPAGPRTPPVLRSAKLGDVGAALGAVALLLRRRPGGARPPTGGAYDG
ncbi:ROK family protein [Streptomyces sp. NPDC054784]